MKSLRRDFEPKHLKICTWIFDKRVFAHTKGPALGVISRL